MAQKEVVGFANDPFVKAMAKAVETIEVSHGPLYAALLAHLPDRPTDDWVFLVGSTKLTKRRLDGIRAIVNAINKTVPNELATRIRRVDVLRTDEPLYAKLSRALKLSLESVAELISCNIYGLDVEHAIVFVMNRMDSARAKARRAVRRPRRAAKV